MTTDEAQRLWVTCNQRLAAYRDLVQRYQIEDPWACAVLWIWLVVEDCPVHRQILQ